MPGIKAIRHSQIDHQLYKLLALLYKTLASLSIVKIYWSISYGLKNPVGFNV